MAKKYFLLFGSEDKQKQFHKLQMLEIHVVEIFQIKV